MRDLIERLENNSIPEPNSGCWIWTGAISSGSLGYGSLRIGRNTTRAHRAAYEAFRGSIPSGMFVCHKCDVSLCINPDHLFLGTPADNNKDRREKGRDHWIRRRDVAERMLAIARAAKKQAPVGGMTNSAKLTEDDVRRIRMLAKNGVRQRALAFQFGISQSTVSALISKQTWGHINDTE